MNAVNALRQMVVIRELEWACKGLVRLTAFGTELTALLMLSIVVKRALAMSAKATIARVLPNAPSKSNKNDTIKQKTWRAIYNGSVWLAKQFSFAESVIEGTKSRSKKNKSATSPRVSSSTLITRCLFLLVIGGIGTELMNKFAPPPKVYNDVLRNICHFRVSEHSVIKSLFALGTGIKKSHFSS